MNTEEEFSREEELRKTPFLNEYLGDSVFSAPDGYFDSFGSNLADRIREKRTFPALFASVFVKPAVVIPVTIVLAAAVLWFSRPGAEQKTYTSDMFYEAAIMDGLDETILCEYLDEEDAAFNEMEAVLLQESNEDLLLNEL